MIALRSLRHGSPETSAVRQVPEDQAPEILAPEILAPEILAPEILPPEVLARLRQAALASCAPAARGDAGPLYDVLLSLAFARGEVLAIAGSLLEHVARDVVKDRADPPPQAPPPLR